MQMTLKWRKTPIASLNSGGKRSPNNKRPAEGLRNHKERTSMTDVNSAIGLLGGAHQIAYKAFMGYSSPDRDDLRNLLEYIADALERLGFDPAKEQTRIDEEHGCSADNAAHVRELRTRQADIDQDLFEDF
jgi:hypothetical protein